MRVLSLVMLLLCATIVWAEDSMPQADQMDDGMMKEMSETNETVATESKPAKVPLHLHHTLRDMLKENNRMRAEVGLPPHRIDPELTKAAQDHAWYMARTGSFSHWDNGGPMGRAVRHDYDGWVSENIAWGQINVAHAFTSWRNSSGHWANMTSNTIDAGFGYAIAPNGSTYWVAMYGNPSSAESVENDHPVHQFMAALVVEGAAFASTLANVPAMAVLPSDVETALFDGSLAAPN